MNEIVKWLNFKVEYQNISWDVMIQVVFDKQYDIGMIGIIIKDECKEKVDFLDFYMCFEQFMLVCGDEKCFIDVKFFVVDMKFLVGVQLGMMFFYIVVYSVFDGDEKNLCIKFFEIFGVIVQVFKVGDVDIVLIDGMVGKGYVDVFNGGLKFVGGLFGIEDFGFIFFKGFDFVKLVNVVIVVLKVDGMLDVLNKKWFFDYKMGQ